MSKEAKERAKKDGYKNEPYDFLTDDLTEQLKELLKENGIIGEPKLYYSLSYCQGDGACFAGDFKWKSNNISIIHRGNYYHSNSVEITVTDENDNELDNNEFKVMYQKICCRIEKSGYSILEYRMSDDEFQELCDSNGYTFFKDGKKSNL